MSLKFRIAIVIFVLEAVMMALVLWKTLGHAVDSSERQIKASEEAALAIVSNIGRLVIQRHSGAVRAVARRAAVPHSISPCTSRARRSNRHTRPDPCRGQPPASRDRPPFPANSPAGT